MKLRDAYTQILVVGFVAFCCPGFFNALTGLGGAGNASPTAGNNANTALYACFAVVGYFGGALFSMFGNKLLMFGGGLTYALYAAGMYIVGNVDNTDWLAPLVGAILGVGAACLWTSQGAMMMAYATPDTKGKYIAVFWVIFNLGGTAGGLLQFILNFNAKRPELGEDEDGNTASAASYFTFVVIMLIGAIASLFLLVSPEKVEKADGSEVHFEQRPALEEIKEAFKVITHPIMLLMTATFLASNWFYAYQLNYLNGMLFTIRTRGFNSALYWGTQMFGSWLSGIILDQVSVSKRRRALNCYVYVFISLGIFWILSFCVNFAFEDHYDKDNTPYRIDITDSQRCLLPVFALIFAAIGDSAMQTFSYWLMGAVTGDDANMSARFAGYYKGVQSVGAAVSWALDINDTPLYKWQLVIAFVLWVVSTITQLFAIRYINDDNTVRKKVQDSTNQLDV